MVSTTSVRTFAPKSSQFSAPSPRAASAPPRPPHLRYYIDEAEKRRTEATNLAANGDPSRASEILREGINLLRQGSWQSRKEPNICSRFKAMIEDYEQVAQTLDGAPLTAQSHQTTPNIEPIRVEGGTGVTMADVVGAVEAKRHLLAAIRLPLQLPQLFKGNRKPWRGVLMYGPPGTGKTLLARAAAGLVNSAFYCVSIADVMHKHLGDSEKFIDALFKEARANAPAVIFIDEVDAILAMRGDGEHEAMRRIKNQFFAAMEGFHQDDRVMVIAATNRPWDLDPAALRRFEKRVHVGLPSMHDRALLFAKKLEHMPHRFTPADYADFAASTPDRYSGADIAIAVKEAAYAPALRIEDASHFVRNPQGQLTPCDASTPGAVLAPADLSSLQNEDLFDEITREDVLQAIRRQPCTLTAAQCDAFAQYEAQLRTAR